MIASAQVGVDVVFEAFPPPKEGVALCCGVQVHRQILQPRGLATAKGSGSPASDSASGDWCRREARPKRAVVEVHRRGPTSRTPEAVWLARKLNDTRVVTIADVPRPAGVQMDRRRLDHLRACVEHPVGVVWASGAARVVRPVLVYPDREHRNTCRLTAVGCRKHVPRRNERAATETDAGPAVETRGEGVGVRRRLRPSNDSRRRPSATLAVALAAAIRIELAAAVALGNRPSHRRVPRGPWATHRGSDLGGWNTATKFVDRVCRRRGRLCRPAARAETKDETEADELPTREVWRRPSGRTTALAHGHLAVPRTGLEEAPSRGDPGREHGASLPTRRGPRSKRSAKRECGTVLNLRVAVWWQMF